MPEAEKTKAGEVKATAKQPTATDNPFTDSNSQFEGEGPVSDQKSLGPLASGDQLDAGDQTATVEAAPDLFVKKSSDEQPVGNTGMIPATSIARTASIHQEAASSGKTWRELIKDDYRARVDVAMALKASNPDPNAVNVDLETIATLAQLLDELQEEGVIRGDSVIARLQAKTDRL